MKSADSSHTSEQLSSENESKLHKAQSFAMERVHRSKLNGAPYNPRIIDNNAKKKLEDNLKKVGLVEPLVWNKQTGNLVSGHQRMSILDALAGTDDYVLDVAVVDLTPSEEKQQNVFLNNPSAQGQWQTDELFTLLKDVDVDLEKTGFETLELELLLGEEQVSELMNRSSVFNIADDGLVAQAEAEDLKRQDREAEKAAKKAAKEAEKQTQEYIDKAKKDKRVSEDKNEDKEFYSVVVFESRAQREEFQAYLGYDPGIKYVDGMRLMNKLKSVDKFPQGV